MPYVNIKITREGTTSEQKSELIKGATDLLVRVLNKTPATIIMHQFVEQHGLAKRNPSYKSLGLFTPFN